MLSSLPVFLERLAFGPDGVKKPSRPANKASTNSSAASSPTQVDDEKDFTFTQKALQRSKKASKPLQSATTLWRNISTQPEATWHPKFFQIRPLAGIGALCVAVGCVFASLVVLIISDGQSVSGWPIPPSVYLAIVTAVANSALALARIEATPVSRSVVQAIAYSRHMSLLNIACLAAAVVVIDGPLLQLSSSITRDSQTSNVTLYFQLAPELPTGFSGMVQYHGIKKTPELDQVSREYMTQAPITLNASQCDGKCRAVVRAPGVTTSDCRSQTWPITREMFDNVNASWGPWHEVSIDEYGQTQARNPIFSVDLSPDWEQPNTEAAKLIVGLASWFNWEGAFVETICHLLPAILEYDVVFENGEVEISQHANQGRMISLVNNTQAIDQSTMADLERIQPDTIDGITGQVGILVAANSSAAMYGFSGSTWRYDPLTFNPEVLRHVNLSNVDGDVNFIDPTSDIVFTFNKWMFRAATVATRTWPNLTDFSDPGISVNQTVRATQEKTGNVFQTDLRWYAGAAAIELVTVLLILPMFWGWWTLGCDLTLPPFATALAFDSPILKDINSAFGAKGVVQDLGTMKLKFGVVYSGDELAGDDMTRVKDGFAAGRLGISESNMVSYAVDGLRFRK